MTTPTAEAVIDGKRTYDERRELVRNAIQGRARQSQGELYVYCYVADMTDTDVVYSCGGDLLMQCTYAIDAAGSVTLGDAVEVVRTYAPATAATEAVTDHVEARVIEAKGVDDKGGRVFRVRIVETGVSKNRRRYTEAVLREAAPLYEGARAFDHHRTAEELATSTINGLVGHYRNVEAQADGIYGDLHLLPSATHAAESLDAAVAAQAEGLEPVVGISHDVRATFKVGSDAHGRLQEAVQIVSVDSADIVAKPSAGGKAVRVVAGGETTTTVEESDVPTPAEILAAFKEASDEDLAAVGLARAPKTTESITPPAQRVTEGEGGESTREADTTMLKTSAVGKMVIAQKVVADAGLPQTVVESVTASLPDRFTEAQLDGAIAGLKDAWAALERGGLTPSAGNVQVTKEAQDKKVEALDKFFEGKGGGYHSFREAVVDITGIRKRTVDEDFNRTILRECMGQADFNSGSRATESLTAASFAQVLGDSITRRMIAEYARPNLQNWRKVVSSTPSVNDFRTQRISRVGGYGVLPVVNEGAPYQPLTSPDDEEATYALTKKGGTEDITLEMIANDDVRVISKIPFKLGLAAAQTLYRFVWDMFVTNAATTYDSVAWFHSTHANTDTASALSQATLSVGRRKMREQAAYGDSYDVLSLVPKFLIVPPELEELAFQLCTSAVAIPSSGNSTDIPNLHQGLEPIVIDYWTDANDWFLTVDPAMCPTIEVGFYQGRQDPELFTQADPNSGSVFNADKFTYKLRHIYQGTAVEHRGVYRGQG